METYKIALVSDWYFPGKGGIEYHIHDLARCLTERGHEVHVITKNGRNPRDVEYYIHRFKGKINIKKFHVSIGTGMLKRIDKLYEKEKFDVTHSHSIFSPLAVSVANLSSGFRDIPTVMTSHSLLGKTILNPVYVSFLRVVLGKVDSFIAVSNAVRKDLEKILGKTLNGRKIFVVHNGIDTDFWKPKKGKKKYKEMFGLGENVVVTTSRLTRRKRVDVIPKIAKEVNKKIDVEFLIIGDGPEKSKVRPLSEKYKVKEKVKLVGSLEREQVRDYLYASDIYLSPSIYEAFSIAVLEALSVNLPILVRKESGAAEIVKNGVNGYLVKKDKDFSKRIIYLFNNRKRLDELSKNYKTVKEKYSLKKMIKEIEKVYKYTIETHNDNRFRLLKLFNNR